MKKNKTKKVTITPKGSRVKSLGKSKAKAAASRGWHESDIHFDTKGRMIIRNRKLAGRILDTLEGDSEIVVITPPLPIVNPRPPNPANSMCGCKLIRLVPDAEKTLNEFGQQGKLSLGIH